MPASDYPRNCGRCGADLHAPDPTHLCKDLAKRLARQEKAIALVNDLLDAHEVSCEQQSCRETLVLDIIKALSGRDLGD